jgi:ribose transport system substrate-binding protein
MVSGQSEARGGPRYRRGLPALVVMAVVGFLAAACGSSSSGSAPSASVSSSNSSSSSAPAGAGSAQLATAAAAASAAEAPATKILQTMPLAQKPPTGKLFVWLADPIPQNSQIAAEVKLAIAAIGWKYVSLAYNPGNPATVQSALNNALEMKASVVGESGVPTSQLGASEIAAYQKAAIPIIETNDIGTNSPDIWGSPASAFEIPGAKALAGWFIADSNGKGNVLVEDASVFPLLNQFDNAFASDVKAECSGCTVQTVDVPPDDLTNGQLIPAVVSRLRADSKIDYVSFDDGAFADGARAQLNVAGLNKVKIIGTGMDSDGAAGIKAGTESAWMSVSFYYQGDALVDAAIRAVEHIPGIGGDTVTTQQLIDSNNIAQFGTGSYPPAEALQQFEALWKVPVTPCVLNCS